MAGKTNGHLGGGFSFGRTGCPFDNVSDLQLEHAVACRMPIDSIWGYWGSPWGRAWPFTWNGRLLWEAAATGLRRYIGSGDLPSVCIEAMQPLLFWVPAFCCTRHLKKFASLCPFVHHG